jgi:8-oxo-dGTP pyrophosphatase MutT (NUDIX family)
MLVRDSPRLEVFMLRRSLRSVFVGGAYVFPGGAVDGDDRELALLALVDGISSADADARLGGPGALGFWVAAIRESFEEAGVLLARDAPDGSLVIGDTPAFDIERRRLIAGERPFLDVVRDLGCVLDAGALAPFARWITPPGNSRRYDTWFFVAAAPDGHVYEHDDGETVASTWLRPADALAQARDGAIELIYPTFRSLQTLARFDRADDLLDAVHGAWREREQPMLTVNPGQGWVLDLPSGGRGAPGADDDADAIRYSTTSAGRARGRAEASG